MPTPSIKRLYDEGAVLARMYSENMCTTSLATFMTGRRAFRTGIHITKLVPPEGVRLNTKEVIIAELPWVWATARTISASGIRVKPKKHIQATGASSS